MTDYSKCPFCKVGQYRRMLMWRLVKDLSGSQLKDKLSKKRSTHKQK